MINFYNFKSWSCYVKDIHTVLNVPFSQAHKWTRISNFYPSIMWPCERFFIFLPENCRIIRVLESHAKCNLSNMQNDLAEKGIVEMWRCFTLRAGHQWNVTLHRKDPPIWIVFWIWVKMDCKCQELLKYVGVKRKWSNTSKVTVKSYT